MFESSPCAGDLTSAQFSVRGSMRDNMRNLHPKGTKGSAILFWRNESNEPQRCEGPPDRDYSMFCVRKIHRWRPLVRAGQTRKLYHPALLFAVLQTLLYSKAACATPSGIASGAPLPCVAAPIRCAFQSALIINSVFREFFEVRLAEAACLSSPFSKSQKGFWLSLRLGLGASHVKSQRTCRSRMRKRRAIPCKTTGLIFLSHSMQLSSI